MGQRFRSSHPARERQLPLLAGFPLLWLLLAHTACGLAPQEPRRGAIGGGGGEVAAKGGARWAPAAGAPPPRRPHLAADPADDAVFDNGEGAMPYDADGSPVHAHEGHLLVQDNGLYLWYGTGQKHAVEGQGWASDSVHLYTSRDLSAWRHKGRVFSAASIADLEVPPPYRIGRVKALYNAAKRQYVLLFGLTSPAPGGEGAALDTIGYATSVSPYGPFKWELAEAPGGAAAGEIGAAQEEDGGAAYLVSSAGNNRTAISRLRGDYLGTAGVPCNTAPRAGAPVPFKSGGRWYLLGSRHRPWQPAEPLLFVTDGPDPCSGAWSRLPRPAQGPGAATAMGSTPAFVHAHRWADGSELLVYAGDRWNLRGSGSVANATYVWLPLLPAGGDGGGGGGPPSLRLEGLAEWRLGDYKPPAPTAAAADGRGGGWSRGGLPLRT